MASSMDAQALADSHRYFAIECNNFAWSVAESDTALQQQEVLLNAAHASAYHWYAVGTDLQKMRATMLLANVHALLGLADTALRYATQMREFFLAQAKLDDWELAFVHTIYARACAAAGNLEDYRDSYSAAQKAIADIADDDDRAIVLVTFSQLSCPA